MRYRTLDAQGDYTFGASARNFLVDSPDAVAQAVRTRLMLFRGEWFYDTSQGMPWKTDVLGKGTEAIYDLRIQAQILKTQGVTGIAAYASQINKDTRALSVQATIDTQFGQATVSTTL